MNYIDAKPLFVIKCFNQKMFDKSPRRKSYLMYATQDRIDSYNKYECCNVQVVKQTPAPKNWPDCSVVVEGSSGLAGNCYRTGSYTVTSRVALTDDDFEILRAQGAFMSGQETGVVCGHEELPDGTHKYICRSTCDSSD